ncbi:MAG TPA: hypothetical protein VFR31_19540 [Thermoanaerobaculia bacterium]|nr:hypothetical protein [Thermoanaerobaculia bacterium]
MPVQGSDSDRQPLRQGNPIAVFAHNNYIAGKEDKKWCYYTYSGATPSEIDGHVRDTLAPWDWE